MPNYTLNIGVNENDLKTIWGANEKIVIVKRTAGNTGRKIAWISFRPFMPNTIHWKNSFAVYASNTEIQGGATINKLSDKEASRKILYDFDNGYFGSATPCTDLGENTYAIKNSQKDFPSLTFSLSQDVSVNGQTASMTPIEKLDVYLRNDVEDGTVISHIISVTLPVEYSEAETTHTIAYDVSVDNKIPATT